MLKIKAVFLKPNEPFTWTSGIKSIPAENYKELKGARNVVVHTDLGGTLTLFFNVRDGVLADPKMRKAVNAALNMDDIMLASFADKDLYARREIGRASCRERV